jgi:hypothetical protein
VYDESHQSYADEMFGIPSAIVPVSTSEGIIEVRHDNNLDGATTAITPIYDDDESMYKDALLLTFKEELLLEHPPSFCLMSRLRAPQDYSEKPPDSQQTSARNTLFTPSHPRVCERDTITMHTDTSGDATPEWTPFIRVSTKDSAMLNELGNSLQATLTVTNEVLTIARREFPKIEDTFASASNAVQSMVTQLVDANRAFHEVKLQLQAHTKAVNSSVQTLTTDIDKLRALHQNIRKEDFETSDYLDLFVDLASCMHHHLAKTHNPDGEDLMDFREFTRHAVDIIMKLDPSTCHDSKDWSGIFRDLLTTMHSQSKVESAQRSAERKLVGHIKEALDQIPHPTNPRVGPSNTNRNGNSHYRAKHNKEYQGNVRMQHCE